jgi:hypothetical protein
MISHHGKLLDIRQNPIHCVSVFYFLQRNPRRVINVNKILLRMLNTSIDPDLEDLALSLLKCLERRIFAQDD